MSLREAVRAEATERTWSQGVTLAREQRVTGRDQNGSELELEVRVPGRPTPFEVVLDRENEEWQCNCTSKEAVCSHVVAAVLATEQAGNAMPTSSKAGAPIRYLLEPDPGGVKVERVLVRDGNSEPLKTSLMSLVGKGKANHIATQETDLLVDQLLGVKNVVNGEKLDRVLEALADARDVRWRGDPVKTNGEPVLPRAVVDDIADGVRVRIERDPIVREVVAVGVARTEDNELRPIGAVDLGGTRFEKLPQSFDVPRSALPELMGKTLPALSQRISVSVRANALPQVGAREQPRMQIDVEQDGDKLIVFPTLVYGDPPRARIDGRTLVHLEGNLPIRDEDAERRLLHRLRDELNLVPGRRVELVGREAFVMQQGLGNWLRSDAKAAAAAKAAPLDVRVVIDGDRLDVDLFPAGRSESDPLHPGAGGGKSASVGAALRAWQAGIDVVPLAGGG